uniref:Pheophorbide a oxygenase domain-containing protein n=1 Tax=Oryza punctata TaxID=4537 RepID=A0A0E0KKF8_ORYPU
MPYELLVENLMDPAHVPYAHKGLFGELPRREDPASQFVAPCTVYGTPIRTDLEVKKKKMMKPEVRVVLFSVPVAPGRSRFIWASRYKVGGWLDKILPHWFYHVTSNSILDSDTYLLHVEERNITTVGLDNWHKACYVPTSSDNLVVAYRNWFRKYCNHQIGWAKPNPTVNQQLPPTPTRAQLLERYWSHVMQCTSCSVALKRMRALEVALLVASVAVVGFLAAGKGTVVTSSVQRAAVVARQLHLEDLLFSRTMSMLTSDVSNDASRKPVMCCCC